MERRYLHIPFEEREQAKHLGARWDAEAKCWFIDSALDPAPFRRWLEEGPRSARQAYSIVSDRAFVLSAGTRCWKCRAGIRVVCIYCASGCVDGEPCEQFTVSNIKAIDENLRRQLEAIPCFRFAYSRDAGGRYLINHCGRCGAQQADYYLHCEPSGMFFTVKEAPAGAFEVTPLLGRVRLTGDEGYEP